MQLVFAYPCRRIGVVPLPNAWIHVAVGFGVLLQLSTVLLAPLRALLGLVPIGGSVLAAIIAAVLATWAVAELMGQRARLSRSQAALQAPDCGSGS